MKRLREAKSDEDKNAATAELSTVLANYFEKDIQQRERELRALEQRVRGLREQFDKRRAAQDEILELQLEVLKNEAEGLGFFSEPMGANAPNRLVESGVETICKARRWPPLQR